MSKLFLIAAILGLAFAAQIGTDTDRCLSCMLDNESSRYFTDTKACMASTDEAGSNSYEVDDWINCKYGDYKYSVGESCSTFGITLT